MLLSTARLTLRRFRPEDAAAVAAYRSDPEVARYQPWDPSMSAEQSRLLVAVLAGGDPLAPGWFQYAIEREGVLLGDVGVNTHDNRMQAEIGYTLAPAHQGHGYATEAVSRVVAHLFEDRGLHRLSAECDARNLRSARLLERVGFRREGLRRHHTWMKGEWTDDLLYGLLATDWPPAAATAPPAARDGVR
ncbi:GNAT family protein [Sphaerisporangium sp. TRM90804]|uniref:GNAT family N-acetyltransferase n=1 Tax=Sphaerisporangium sp. TRM90804 TaxID=3031113 RepID=UPI002446B674|nr:GNAT family protein [Sphaerisporangium sp. TRM90804]MDH2427181.1 GNAT family protein [Sphaerisporangium sp. TRM90804]